MKAAILGLGYLNYIQTGVRWLEPFKRPDGADQRALFNKLYAGDKMYNCSLLTDYSLRILITQYFVYK